TMTDTRRSFLKKVAGSAAVAAAGVPLMRAQSHAPGTGFYGYLGRTKDYREWQVIPAGLKITKVESFLRQQLAMVRITTEDGATGWGQMAPYDANISVEALHQRVASRVLGRDASTIDAINDDVIDANMKYPWS